ncbi:hypothetical protein PUN28_018480 [Cardiocondyla obscurior]|uniref:Uncharacterized protein n=1 Tax=Cardiocondyla obscurior TaxID=286306 RepID=A0AAW2EGQ4_9HYME
MFRNAKVKMADAAREASDGSDVNCAGVASGVLGLPLEISSAGSDNSHVRARDPLLACLRRGSGSHSVSSSIALVNAGIIFDPAFSDLGWIKVCLVHSLVGKCLTWKMGYVATEANKRISYDGEENNVCTEQIALHIAADVWKRAGLAESMYQKILRRPPGS